MVVLSIVLFNLAAGEESVKIHQCFEVSSFGYFTRGTVKEAAVFGSRTVIDRTQMGQRQSIIQPNQEALDDTYVCHAHLRNDGLGGTCITDESYPIRVAYALLAEAMEAFSASYEAWADISVNGDNKCAEVEALLAKYQDPAEADTMTRIQADIDDTRDEMLLAIDNILVRGEKIDDLAQKSNDLSSTSKTFMKKSKKLNSCCAIL